jgi:hypothetical protein
MGKFIEEFYYGNIDPQARSTKQNKAVQKQMAEREGVTEQLKANYISKQRVVSKKYGSLLF